MEKLKYEGGLIGRIFFISPLKNAIKWHGCTEDSNGLSDYNLFEEDEDLLADYEEGDIKIFKKVSENLDFPLFFTFSQRIELFKKTDSVILCEGLFFNESLEKIDDITINLIEKTALTLLIENDKLVIFEATNDGNDIVDNMENAKYKLDNEDSNSYALFHLKNGAYSIKKVSVDFIIEGEDISLLGVELSLDN
jgi:hypothetical protein